MKMSDYVYKNTCGACSYFEYDGPKTRGYCTRIGTYYYPDESSCSKYDEDEDRLSSGSSGCFITSACCEYKGLPDDCDLMQKLRRFRDTYIKSLPEGEGVIKEYYRIAPLIVSSINNRDDADAVYEEIYSSLLQAESLIDSDHNKEAYELYTNMVLSLKDRYTNDAGRSVLP